MEEIMAKERQLAAREKELILEFEGHLAAASSKNLITEKNSLLLSQVITGRRFLPRDH
jgi:integrator complex subunit 1